MALDQVGSIEYDSRINTKNLKKDAAEVDSIASGTAKSLGNTMDQSESGASKALENVMGKVKTVAIATATAITGAATAAAAFGVKSAADFEQTRIGLENMLGSADKARSLLSDISDFAAQTPFEFPELAQATRQLVAFGFSGQEAFDTMKQLGDVSAAVGAPINDLAYLMGTLRTQGRAFTVDIRQFAQRGIPIYEYLAKVLNTTEKSISSMIEEGKIGFPEVQKAFQAMTAEGGKFYKTMDKQSASLSGQFSTLKDNLGQTLRELVGISKEGDVVKGSLFDRIRTGIGEVNGDLPRMSDNFKAFIAGQIPQLKQWGDNIVNVGARITDYLGPKLGAVGQNVMPFLNAVRELVAAVGPTAGAGLVWALGLAIDALNLLLVIATPVLNFLKEHTSIVYALAGAYGVMRAAMMIQAGVGAVMAGLAAVNAALAVTQGSLLATAGGAGILRGALILLASPWVITVTAVGILGVIESVKALNDLFEKLQNNLNKTNVQLKGSNIKVKGGSDLGLVQQLQNAFGGFRAAGGPVAAGKAYVVGENQPEVFVPRTAGTIIPDVNDFSGGGGSVNLTLNLSGIMTRSKSDERDIAKSLIRRVNEELSAKGQPILGGGSI